MAGAFTLYGQRFTAQAQRAMSHSRERVHAHAAQLTPVRTGRMRSLLRDLPTERGLGYLIGWVAEDFFGEAQPFYAPIVVLGSHARHIAARDPLTPAIEAERPTLLADLRLAAESAARGA